MTKPTKYVCLHGHFYQPPRENAWLERIERQESAHPFHDWNERIETECYGPNARARVLDTHDRVVAIVNNYERISFNVGPTLLSWLEVRAPRTYKAILDADRLSATRFGGHGSAMAQAYNHLIMPLANDRDRQTQVGWGIRDFTHRFGRAPIGMWLPETAACTKSLRALADAGIKFTVLSPRQAKAIRAPGHAAKPVDESKLDTRRAYKVDLGDGKSIAVFFYDGATSQAVAFERLLSSGEGFATRLLAPLKRDTTTELVHIATDGETYGHHHRFGEMALAYALDRIDKSEHARLTNYAEFLALHPPEHEAIIVEDSAWSCAHGVGRWSADCGCRTRGDSNQAWRGPLRAALDGLRERVDAIYEREAGELFSDPWVARNDYIDVVLARTKERTTEFLDRHRKRPLDAAASQRAIELCEMQRHRMLMYTSCGWFFDDVSGIETIQILQYAARVAELAQRVSGQPVDAAFKKDLEAARATTPGAPSGREVYERHALPSRVDLARACASHAVVSMFSRNADVVADSFDVEERSFFLARRDSARIVVGRALVRSMITGEHGEFAFAVTHAGGPTVEGGLLALEPGQDPEEEALLGHFEDEPLDQVRRRIAAAFPIPIDSLRVVTVDERVVVVERIVDESVRKAEVAYRQVFVENQALLEELASTGVWPPRALSVASRVVLEIDLRRAANAVPPDTAKMRELCGSARRENVKFDQAEFGLSLRKAIERACAELEKEPGDRAALTRLDDLVTIANELSSHFDLSRAQDLAWIVLRDPVSPEGRAAREADTLDAWKDVARDLKIRVEG